MSMTHRRLAQLLQKELDGELSAVEKDELVRLEARDPEARRERRAWKRFEQAMHVPAPGAAERARPLDAARMTSRVLSARREPPKAQPLKLERFDLRRLLLVSSAIAAGALVLWAGTLEHRDQAALHPAPVEVRTSPRAESIRAREKKKHEMPVEVWLGDLSGKEDRELAPVNIRF